MKHLMIGALIVALATALTPGMADAKRLGGGKSTGLQRDMPARTAPDALPAKPAPTPAQNPAAAGAAAQPGAAAAAAAAPAKRSWMGPLAGLAAGLGLAALASHLGFGAEFGNIMMILLLAMAGFALFAFLRRRAAGNGAAPALAGVGAGAGAGTPPNPWPGASAEPVSTARTALEPAAPAMSAPAQAGAAAVAPVAAAFVPAAFDSESFARTAKAIFLRMQAANDSANLDDLRQFTTPELFAQFKLDLMDRGDAKQTTDVRHVEAKVLDVAEESDRQIVSVRYRGKLTEGANEPEQLFDEVWHLVKARADGANWLIAGIEQMS